MMRRDLMPALASATGGVLTALLLGVVLLSLPGCSAKSPDVQLVATPPQRPHHAPECISKDKPFPRLPEDRDSTDQDAMRDRRLAKDRYDDLLGKREVCRASLLAQQTPPLSH